MPGRAYPLALGALALAALLVRLPLLGQSLYADELFTYVIVTRDGLGDVLAGIRETENTPPAYYLLAWLCTRVGESPELARLPSLVAGVATVPLAGALAGRAFRPAAGIVAAALVAFSPFAAFYATEARAYAAAAACVAAALLALLRLLDVDRPARRALYAVLAAGAVWMHYTAVFPLAATGLWALVARPEQRRAVVVAGAAAAVLYLPWLPFLRANGLQAVIALLTPASVERVVLDPVIVLFGLPYVELDLLPGAPILAGLGVALVLAAVLAAREASDEPRAPALLRLARGPVGMLAVAALATPAGIALYTLFGSGLQLPRNLLTSAPAALALLAGLLTAARGRRAVLLGGAVIAALAVGMARAEGDAFRRPPYDEVARRLDAVARPAEPVIDVGIFPVGAPLDQGLRVELRRPHPVYDAQAGARRAWSRGVRAGRVWVVRPGDALFGTVAIPRDPRFRLVARREWDGLIPIALEEHVLRPGAVPTRGPGGR